jgi:hypothetical protein
MKIRKSAWHHRFYTFGFETYSETYQPVNLCSYFWRIVAGLCKSLLIAAVALGLLTIAAYALYTYPVVVLGSAGFVMAFIVVGTNWTRIKNFLCRTKVTSEPGLLRSYLKAKKDKVCPLITFVE